MSWARRWQPGSTGNWSSISGPGAADAAGAGPWREDTLATVLSGTKGLISTCVHQLVERGEIDVYAPVARYWPEFGQAGKEGITLAMVMSHRSGVIGPRTRMSWKEVADWDSVCEQLAAAQPWWEPGTAQGYHNHVRFHSW